MRTGIQGTYPEVFEASLWLIGTPIASCAIMDLHSSGPGLVVERVKVWS